MTFEEENLALVGASVLVVAWLALMGSDLSHRFFFLAAFAAAVFALLSLYNLLI
jgi:hypothetical protein